MGLDDHVTSLVEIKSTIVAQDWEKLEQTSISQENEPAFHDLLPFAISKGAPLTVVKKFVNELGMDVNFLCTSEYDGGSALFYACEAIPPKLLNIELIRFLLESGADPNLVPKRVITPLLLALRSRCSKEVVRLLLDHGADVNRTDFELYTPLHVASYYGDLEVAKLFVEAGAELNPRTAAGVTPIYLATERGGKLNVLEYLAERGADIDLASNSGQSPLMAAILAKDVESVRFYIKRGANVNLLHPRYGIGLLHWALQTNVVDVGSKNTLEIVSMLLQAGCDARLVPPDGNSVLCIALASRQSIEVIRLLLDAGTPVDVPNKGSLALAVDHGHGIEVIRLLLEHKADVNARGRDGMPLAHIMDNKHRAVPEQVELCRILLDAKSDPNLLSYQSELSALQVALMSGPLECVKLMVEKGNANVDVVTKDGVNCLHIAAVNPSANVELISYILEKGGMDVNSKATQSGFTAFLYAAENCNIPVCRYLKDKGTDVALQVDGKNALNFAVTNFHIPDSVVLEMINFLFEVNCPFSGEGLRPVILDVIRTCRPVKILELVLDHGGTLHYDKTLPPPLHALASLGVSKGQAENTAKFLVGPCGLDVNEKWANLAAKENSEMTPFRRTVCAHLPDRWQLLQVLIDGGADLTKEEPLKGKSLLREMIDKSFPSRLLEYVIKARPQDVNSYFEYGFKNNMYGSPMVLSPLGFSLYYYMYSSGMEVVQLLESNGAVLYPPLDGETPLGPLIPTRPVLHYAIAYSSGLDEIRIDKLIELGDDVNEVVPALSGETALGIAISTYRVKVIPVLIDKGANVNHIISSGLSLLDLALEKNKTLYPNIIQVLKDAGAVSALNNPLT